jgi:hypothetical protein
MNCSKGHCKLIRARRAGDEDEPRDTGQGRLSDPSETAHLPQYKTRSIVARSLSHPFSLLL